MRRGTTIGLTLGLGVALGVAATPVVEPRLPTYPLLRGLRIDGRPVVGAPALRGWLEGRAAEQEGRTVELRAAEQRFTATLAELGARVDVVAVERMALAAGHTGSWLGRLRQTAAARRGQLDLPLAWRFDTAVARHFVTGLSKAVAQPPVDAHFDLRAHRRVPDVPGRALDPEASVLAVATSYSRAEPIELVVRASVAEVRLADLDNIDISRVLSSFETHFNVWKRGRSFNVGLAADRLNGAVMRPGAVLSFNDRVGPRSVERGFKPAPEIVGDELSVGIGGGTCQVSSTLYAAAIYGGMTIVARKSHSRPSSYTKLGLDATVSYPSVDLELANPYPFSVVIHAFLPEPGLLRVELLGGQAVKEVQYRYGVSHIEPFVRRITTKSWLKNGKMMRKQKGTRGMDVHSFVTVVYRDGHVDKLMYFSGYHPTPEVYWVAPDYHAGSLPPLPAHAKGVEGELRADGSDVYSSSE